MTRNEAMERAWDVWGRQRVRTLEQGQAGEILGTEWYVELHTNYETHGLNSVGDVTCGHKACEEKARRAGPWKPPL